MADPDKAKQEHAQLHQEQTQLLQDLRQAFKDLLKRCTYPTPARADAVRARIDVLLDNLSGMIRALGVTEWQDKVKKLVEELESSQQSAANNAKDLEAKEQRLETFIQSFDANAARGSNDKKTIEQLQSKVHSAQADQQQAVTQAREPLQQKIGKQEQMIEELKKQIEDNKRQCSVEKLNEFDRGRKAEKDEKEASVAERIRMTDEERRKLKEERENLRSNTDQIREEVETKFDTRLGSAAQTLEGLVNLQPDVQKVVETLSGLSDLPTSADVASQVQSAKRELKEVIDSISITTAATASKGEVQAAINESMKGVAQESSVRGLATKLADPASNSSLQDLSQKLVGLDKLAKKTDLDNLAKSSDLLGVLRKDDVEGLAKISDLNKLSTSKDAQKIVTGLQDLAIPEKLTSISDKLGSTASKGDVQAAVKESLKGIAQESSVRGLANNSSLQDLAQKLVCLDKLARKDDLNGLAKSSELDDVAKKDDLGGLAKSSDLKGLNIAKEVQDIAAGLKKLDLTSITEQLKGTATAEGLQSVADKFGDLPSKGDVSRLATSQELRELPRPNMQPILDALNTLPRKSDLTGLAQYFQLEKLAKSTEVQGLAKKTDVQGLSTSADLQNLLNQIGTLATTEQLRELPERVWNQRLTDDRTVWEHLQDFLDEKRLIQVVLDAVQSMLDNPVEGANNLPSTSYLSFAISENYGVEWKRLKKYLAALKDALLFNQTSKEIPWSHATTYDTLVTMLQGLEAEVKKRNDPAAFETEIRATTRLAADEALRPQNLQSIMDRTVDQLLPLVNGVRPNIMTELAGLPELIKQALTEGKSRLASHSSILRLDDSFRSLRTLIRLIPGISYAEIFMRLNEIEQNVDQSQPSNAERDAVLTITEEIRRTVRRNWGASTQVDLGSGLSRLGELDTAVAGVEFKNKTNYDTSVSMARRNLEDLSWRLPPGVISGYEVARGVQQLQSDAGRVLQSLRHMSTVDEAPAMSELERLSSMITEAADVGEINEAAETLRKSFISFFSGAPQVDRAMILQQFQALEGSMITASLSPEAALPATTRLLLNLHTLTLDPSTIAADLAQYLAPADSRPGTAASGSQSDRSGSRQLLARPETAQSQIIRFGKHSQHETPSTSHRREKSAKGPEQEIAGSVFGAPYALRSRADLLGKGKQREIEMELESEEESTEELQFEDARDQQIANDDALARQVEAELNKPASGAQALSESEIQPPDPTEGMTEAEANEYRVQEYERQTQLASGFFSARQKGDKNRTAASRACQNHSDQPLTASQANRNTLTAMRDQLVDDVDAIKKRKEQLRKEPKIASMLYSLFESRGQAGSSATVPTSHEETANDPQILDQELANDDHRLDSYRETLGRLNAILQQIEKGLVEDDSSVRLRAKTELDRRQKARETEQQAAATHLTQQSTWDDGLALQDLVKLLDQAIKDAKAKKELLGNDRRLAVALAIQQEDQQGQDTTMSDVDETQEAQAMQQQQQIEDSLVQTCQNTYNTANRMLRELIKRMQGRFDAMKPDLTQAFKDQAASEESAKVMPEVIAATTDRARLQGIVNEQQKLANAAAERNRRIQRDGMFARALADKNDGQTAKGDKVSDKTMHNLIEQEKKIQEDCLKLVRAAQQKLPGQMPPPSAPSTPAPQAPAQPGYQATTTARELKTKGSIKSLKTKSSQPTLSHSQSARGSKLNLRERAASPTPGPKSNATKEDVVAVWRSKKLLEACAAKTDAEGNVTEVDYAKLHALIKLPDMDDLQHRRWERRWDQLVSTLGTNNLRPIDKIAEDLDTWAQLPTRGSTAYSPPLCIGSAKPRRTLDRGQTNGDAVRDCPYHRSHEERSENAKFPCCYVEMAEGVQEPRLRATAGLVTQDNLLAEAQIVDGHRWELKFRKGENQGGREKELESEKVYDQVKEQKRMEQEAREEKQQGKEGGQ